MKRASSNVHMYIVYSCTPTTLLLTLCKQLPSTSQWPVTAPEQNRINIYVSSQNKHYYCNCGENRLRMSGHPAWNQENPGLNPEINTSRKKCWKSDEWKKASKRDRMRQRERMKRKENKVPLGFPSPVHSLCGLASVNIPLYDRWHEPWDTGESPAVSPETGSGWKEKLWAPKKRRTCVVPFTFNS